jgi:holo-[acyl-carrier protein] synthase
MKALRALEAPGPGTCLELAHIPRVDALRLHRPDTLRRLFTDAEWTYCLGHRRADQHLAARLAAKRAVTTLMGRRPYASIEIQRDERGAPCLLIDGQPAPLRVSLSHDGDLAAALVVRKNP